MGSLFGFINDTCVMSHVPDMISTSEYIDERSIGNHNPSDRALSTATLSSALNISRSTPHGKDGRAKTLETPLETPLGHSWTSRHSGSTQDKLSARLSPLTWFHDVIDVVRFPKSPSLSDAATSFSSVCTCLQDLTAGLFGFQTSGENVRVDRLLLLFKRCMYRWKGVDTCASACSTTPSLALLMLMNVQQLVSFLLRALSSARSGDIAKDPELSGSALNINMGSFVVEDRADRRFIAEHLITSTMKEIFSFISTTSLKVNASGLDTVNEEYQRQMERLRQAFT